MERGAFNVKIPRQSVKFVGPWLEQKWRTLPHTHTHTASQLKRLRQFNDIDALICERTWTHPMHTSPQPKSAGNSMTVHSWNHHAQRRPSWKALENAVIEPIQTAIQSLSLNDYKPGKLPGVVSGSATVGCGFTAISAHFAPLDCDHLDCTCCFPGLA